MDVEPQAPETPAPEATEPAPAPAESEAELGLFSVETPEESEPAPANGEQPPQPPVDAQKKLGEAMEHLASRDRELLIEKKRFKDLEERMSRFEQLKEDPDAILRAFGHDPVDYVYKGLQKGEPEPETPEQKIERLEMALQQDQQSRAEAARQTQLQSRYANQQQTYMQTIEANAKEAPYLARMVKQPGGEQLVHQMMSMAAAEYKATGQLIDPSAIIAATEKSTRETIRKNAEALAELDDFRSVFGHTQQPAPKPTHPPAQTLSRQMGGETAAPDSRPMTEEELDQQFLDLIRKDGWVD